MQTAFSPGLFEAKISARYPFQRPGIRAERINRETDHPKSRGNVGESIYSLRCVYIYIYIYIYIHTYICTYMYYVSFLGVLFSRISERLFSFNDRRKSPRETSASANVPVDRNDSSRSASIFIRRDYRLTSTFASRFAMYYHGGNWKRAGSKGTAIQHDYMIRKLVPHMHTRPVRLVKNTIDRTLPLTRAPIE